MAGLTRPVHGALLDGKPSCRGLGKQNWSQRRNEGIIALFGKDGAAVVKKTPDPMAKISPLGSRTGHGRRFLSKSPNSTLLLDGTLKPAARQVGLKTYLSRLRPSLVRHLLFIKQIRDDLGRK